MKLQLVDHTSPYEEMLEALPEDWSVKRLKFVCEINPTKSEVRSVSDDLLVSFLPMEKIGEDGSLDLSEERPLGEVFQGYTYMTNNDVILAKITPCFENGKAALCTNLHNGIGFGTTELHVLRPYDGFHPQFIFYILRSHLFRKMGTTEMSGVAGQQRVPESFVRNFRAGFPPYRHQAAIAAFLDRKTAQIDALITEKRRLIELLQEKRNALISHAVTKGLDPHAPMKDSGVEWIGEVPEHWDIARVKWVATLESGHTPSRSAPEYWENCTIDWVSLNDTKYLANNDYIDQTKYKISELGMANSSARLLPERAVVFTRDATIGLAAITTRQMAVSQHVIAWICGDKLIPEYLLHVFYSMSQELERLTEGATLRTIGMPEVSLLTTPLPPLKEQERIIHHVKEKKAEVDTLITDVEQAIQYLKEYRSALISAAVTGEIDVRETEKAISKWGVQID